MIKNGHTDALNLTIRFIRNDNYLYVSVMTYTTTDKVFLNIVDVFVFFLLC